jgi:chromosome segregation ATPase
MKNKITSLALVLFTAGWLQAQTVTPLNITPTYFELDSLRSQYGESLNTYLSELQRIQAFQTNVSNQIKETEKQLTEEENLLKGVSGFYKQSIKLLEELLRSNEQEVKRLQDVINYMDKQQKEIHKSTRINATTRNLYMDTLTVNKRQLEDIVRDIEMQVETITAQKIRIEALSQGINTLDLDIKNKQIDLNQVTEVHKTRMDTIKNEIKNVKKSIKLQK